MADERREIAPPLAKIGDESGQALMDVPSAPRLGHEHAVFRCVPENAPLQNLGSRVRLRFFQRPCLAPAEDGLEPIGRAPVEVRRGVVSVPDLRRDWRDSLRGVVRERDIDADPARLFLRSSLKRRKCRGKDEHREEMHPS
jgi:hypothetical protein